MSDRVDARFRALIDAVRDKTQTKISDPDCAIDILSQIDLVLDSFDEVNRQPIPSRLPACRYLPDIYSIAKNSNMASIATAFEKLEPYLEWVQNPNYSDARMGEGYMENYAYSDFLGPRGLAGGNDVAAGFLLLGPNILNPDHSHAATEIYFIVAGTADWRRNGGYWREEPPGNIIFHPSWIVHAMRCKGEPLLAYIFGLGTYHKLPI